MKNIIVRVYVNGSFDILWREWSVLPEIGEQVDIHGGMTATVVSRVFGSTTQEVEFGSEYRQQVTLHCTR